MRLAGLGLLTEPIIHALIPSLAFRELHVLAHTPN